MHGLNDDPILCFLLDIEYGQGHGERDKKRGISEVAARANSMDTTS
jgi:hypothetical protein